MKKLLEVSVALIALTLPALGQAQASFDNQRWLGKDVLSNARYTGIETIAYNGNPAWQQDRDDDRRQGDRDDNRKRDRDKNLHRDRRDRHRTQADRDRDRDRDRDNSRTYRDRDWDRDRDGDRDRNSGYYGQQGNYGYYGRQGSYGRGQWQGRLSASDQRRFDSYYSRWLQYRATNNRGEILSMQNRAIITLTNHGYSATLEPWNSQRHFSKPCGTSRMSNSVLTPWRRCDGQKAPNVLLAATKSTTT